MALTDFLEDVCLLTHTAQADGLGSSREEYRRGMLLRAGFVRRSSAEAEMADRKGARSIWRITTLTSDPALQVGDVLLRISDGQRYRVIAQCAQTPAAAQLQCRYVEAEVLL